MKRELLLIGSALTLSACGVSAPAPHAAGAVGALARPAAQEVTVDDTAAGVTYTGPWEALTGLDGRVGGTLHQSDVAGAAVQFTFTGTSVSLIGDRSYQGGRANLYLDGAYQREVTFGTDGRTSRQIIFTLSNLSAGTHTVRLVGTIGYNYIDAFTYTPSKGK